MRPLTVALLTFEAYTRMAGQFEENEPIWTRENVVDSKLTLRCFAGNAENFVNTNYGRLQTEADLVNLMARTAQTQMHVGHLDPILSRKKRGLTFNRKRTSLQQRLVKSGGRLVKHA